MSEVEDFVKKYVIHPPNYDLDLVFLEYLVLDKALEKYNKEEIINFLIEAKLLKKGREILTKIPMFVRATMYYHAWKRKYDCNCGIKYVSRKRSKAPHCPKCGSEVVVY